MRLSQLIRVVLVGLGVISFGFNVWQVWELSRNAGGVRGLAGGGARAGGASGRRAHAAAERAVAAALAPDEAARTRVARISGARRRDARLFESLGLALQSPLDDAALTSSAAAGGEGRAKFADPTDLLRAQWVMHGASRTVAAEIAGADVLWGTWVTNIEFFDHRLHDGLIINSLLGLEHDTLGTAATFAQAHRRCIAAHGFRRCDHASPALFIHAHTDPSRFETVFGEDTLADLATWRHLASNDVRAIWVAKPASYARSQVHRSVELFGGTQLVASNDRLPTGIWSLQPYVTSPLLWKSFRFFARTWVVITSVLPLRLYVLQDGWAHLAAEPYREEQLATNYRSKCVHFPSADECRYLFDTQTLRLNTQAFQGDLSSRKMGAQLEPFSLWRHRAWPSIERAVSRAVLMVWSQLAQYELILRRERFKYRRVGLLDVFLNVDETGSATVHDVDTSGGEPSESLPCSVGYALDAIMLLGVNAFPGRPAYRDRAAHAVAEFCAARGRGAEWPPERGDAAASAQDGGAELAAGCTASEAAELVRTLDEHEHSGNFRMAFPAVSRADGGAAGDGREAGCGEHCYFFETGPSLSGAHAPRRAQAGASASQSAGHAESADAAEARRLNEMLWAFLRAFPPAAHHGPQFSRDGTCHVARAEDEAFLDEVAAGARARADGSDVIEAARAANRSADAYAGRTFFIDRPDASDGAQSATVLARAAGGSASARRASGPALARLAQDESEQAVGVRTAPAEGDAERGAVATPVGAAEGDAEGAGPEDTSEEA